MDSEGIGSNQMEILSGNLLGVTEDSWRPSRGSKPEPTEHELLPARSVDLFVDFLSVSGIMQGYRLKLGHLLSRSPFAGDVLCTVQCEGVVNQAINK
jgi:hypothetical protein